MTQSLQWRIGLIGLVLAATLFLLYPSVGPVPEFWAKHLPNSPIRLGLDLQGGLHLILEVQTDKAVQAVVDQAMNEAGAIMKENRIRYRDIARKSNTSFEVLLKNSAQEPLFDETVLGRIGHFKKVKSEPVGKGVRITLKMLPQSVIEIKRQSVRQAVDTIRNRVDQLGVAEPDVVINGERQIIVQLPGLKADTDRAVSLIKKTARLEFKLVDERGDLNRALKGRIPPGDEILYQVVRDPRTGAVARTPFLVEKQVLMTGDVITDARVRPDQFGSLFVSLTLNSRGARIFERITSRNVGRRLAIILDNKIYSAPEIKSAIPGGRAIIQGRFTPTEASDLALVLRSGSLPAPVKIQESRSVGPSLGEDSIRSGRNAIILGVLLVVVAMAFYYKWSGVVANVALIMNLFLILAVMVSPGIRATLTLPGLAGVALTMGMAIDANILIFERVREELRHGKSPKAALDAGYTRAFWTIFDSNLTTILAALPLIQFGTGPIKGFAVTLCIGLMASMFTALFVTRTIFDYAFQNMNIKRLSI